MNYTPYSLSNDNYYFNWEYRKKKVLFDHKESSVWVTPAILHLLISRINYALRDYHDYERKGQINKAHYQYGKVIKTNAVVTSNLNRIISLANARHSKLILLPINIYIANGYTETSYKNGLLDYKDGTGYPIEIYGDPTNLDSIVSAYKTGMKNKESNNVKFCDAAIPRNRNYYNDVCHLTDAGMETLTSDIAHFICKE
jgi:lysophospholipase L1-like esterase